MLFYISISVIVINRNDNVEKEYLIKCQNKIFKKIFFEILINEIIKSFF